MGEVWAGRCVPEGRRPTAAGRSPAWLRLPKPDAYYFLPKSRTGQETVPIWGLLSVAGLSRSECMLGQASGSGRAVPCRAPLWLAPHWPAQPPCGCLTGDLWHPRTTLLPSPLQEGHGQSWVPPVHLQVLSSGGSGGPTAKPLPKEHPPPTATPLCPCLCPGTLSPLMVLCGLPPPRLDTA